MDICHKIFTVYVPPHTATINSTANEHSRRVHWGWQWRLTSLLKNAWKPSRDTSVSLECWFNGGLSLSTQVTLKWQEMCIPPGSPVHPSWKSCAYSGDTHVNRSARAYGGHNNLPFPETRQSSFYQSHPYASGRSWTAAQCPAGWPNRGSTPASAAALCPPSSGPGSEVKGQFIHWVWLERVTGLSHIHWTSVHDIQINQVRPTSLTHWNLELGHSLSVTSSEWEKLVSSIDYNSCLAWSDENSIQNTEAASVLHPSVPQWVIRCVQITPLCKWMTAVLYGCS